MRLNFIFENQIYAKLRKLGSLARSVSMQEQYVVLSSYIEENLRNLV